MSILREEQSLVHGAWSADWWGGSASLSALFGPAPSPESLDAVARAWDARPGEVERLGGHWTQRVRGQTPPHNALVVLAGQQPVLAGGPALVAHKAATCVALAAALQQRWSRPVVPVFLLATQDHDTDEIDHVDVLAESGDRLRRLRCPLVPRHEAFHRARWEHAALEQTLRDVAGDTWGGGLAAHTDEVSAHVAEAWLDTFGWSGLVTLDAHLLADVGMPVIDRALKHSASHQRALASGAEQLIARDMSPRFDPEDPRPLVLRSHDGRRRRLTETERTRAVEQLPRAPEDFSPHAALRPIVQATSLPVVAQVVGPSELVYLGQARGLHTLHNAIAPILVPRLEATFVDQTDSATRRAIRGEADELLVEERELGSALQRFVRAVGARDPRLDARLTRWATRVRGRARRLAETPGWRGPEPTSKLRPRGRPQDAVLAWLPDAASAPGGPDAWGRHLVSLCLPLDPPVHVLHTGPRVHQEQHRNG